MSRRSARLGNCNAACVVAVVCQLLFASAASAQQADHSKTNASAGQIADFFSTVGDQFFEECIFELSAEQIEVQQALINAYIQRGASDQIARKLAGKQIQSPKLSDKCQQLRKAPSVPPTAADVTKLTVRITPSEPEPKSAVRPEAAPAAPSPTISLTGRKVLPLWDCGPDVDFVTIHHAGYERKLTAGEICNPFEDVVREVPNAAPSFRLGYTIRTGRLFAVSDSPEINGRTITWGLSGRDVCRNNPDPDCLSTRAVGPLPPGEYSFASDKAYRVSWGPKTKRHVAAVYLSKLWYREHFSPRHTAAIRARGNIAIHVRLKGEMSEACIGLEPKGWAYVAALIKDGRATGLNVYIDDPHPQLAEKPPIVVRSSFSLTSLFKQ